MPAYAGAPGPGVGRTDAAAGDQQARAAEPARRLLGTDFERELAFLDALRHDGGDAEIKRAVQVVDDVFPRVIRRGVREAFLEARVPVRIDERRHHRLAGKIDALDAGGRAKLALAPDAGNHPAVDQKRRLVDGRAAIAGNQPRAFVQHHVGRRLAVRRRNELDRDQQPAPCECVT
jgi:hypothetical protein